MKQTFVKKLTIFALAVGMLLPVAAPAVRANAAEKKEVWVLDTEKGRYIGWDGKYEDSYQSKYTYNKNGLLTVAKSDNSSLKYVYKGKKISKLLFDRSGSGKYELYEKYSYDKSQRLIKMVRGDDANYVTKYTWKNGRCVKDALPYTGSKNTYSYNKNGWITKNNQWTIKYDKYGYKISEDSGEGGATYLYKNKYKDGRLISWTAQDESKEERTYKYKKIKVPASYVKQVKLQQEWLTNKGSKQYLPLAAF